MPTILSRLLGQLFGSSKYIINLSSEENPLAEGLSARELYATQANLYAVVSFLAENLAQLPLNVYVREGENDRRRDRNSPAARILWRPNGDQTAFEFWYSVEIERLLMGVATVWRIPTNDAERPYELRLIPREWIQTADYETSYAPAALHITAGTGGETIKIPREDFLQYRYYTPRSPASYQSPLAALRQTLTEQLQADRFRTAVWRSSGRFNAYITRPKDVQPWEEKQREAWIKRFRDAWMPGGPNEGKIPLLEDGMEIKPYQFNAKEAQYAETKQLSREDVAAAYHVNPSLIWHTGTQTYASAKDNARALYSDCLGPTLQMYQQRNNAFLLPMIGAAPNTYTEFDLREKLKGNFEERAGIKQQAVGAPWMTRNEARADENMPPVPGGDELVTPLNVLIGGQASPADVLSNGAQHQQKAPARAVYPPAKAVPDEIRIKGRSSKQEDDRLAAALKAFFKRQAASVLPKLGAKSPAWWDADRWNKELADDMEPLLDAITDAHGESAASDIGADYDTERTRAYIRKLAEGRAEAINAATLIKLQEAAEDEDEDGDTPAEVYQKREDSAAPMLGRTLATAAAGWAVLEACRQAEDHGERRTIEKEWVVNSANPRPSHAVMNGQRVPVNQPFSNGAQWPGDDALGPEETCNCSCSTEVIITEG